MSPPPASHDDANGAPQTPPDGRRQEALGQSPAFLEFQENVRRVAPVDRPVLLVGERGTGKEMAAQRLHFLSERWGQPFVALNCAALSPGLIESELFGHEEGAFTGARRRRVGRFEAADGGTLFLDEISLIPMEVQEKILRVVEYGAFERVGGTRLVEADVRIIGATNADLAAEAAAGRFKADLLDRLAFEVLFLPPLREREEDVALLAAHFAVRMAHELGREETPEFTPDALEKMTSHPWPGNVRELKNVVERAVYRAESAEIDAASLDFEPFRSPWRTPASVPLDPLSLAPSLRPAPALTPAPSTPDAPAGADDAPMEEVSLPDALHRVELHFLRRALAASRYNQRLAAEALGLTYHQFRGLYRKHADVLKGEKPEI